MLMGKFVGTIRCPNWVECFVEIIWFNNLVEQWVYTLVAHFGGQFNLTFI